MPDPRLVTIAAELLRGSEQYTDDARAGAPVGNSVIGSLLNLQHGAPRQVAEQAVLEALRIVDRERMTTTPETHTLRRSGQAPLTFAGELIASVDGERQHGKDRDRWHELAVYRTAGGKYVLAIEYATRWQGEGGHYFAEVLGGPEHVAAELRGYDPTEHVVGYPAAAGYQERQARLLADLRGRFGALVSELLGTREEFAERIA